MPPYLTCTIPPTEAQNVQIHTPLHIHSLELCRAATILHPPDTCLSSQIPHLELQTLVCDCLHVEADCCAEKKTKKRTGTVSLIITTVSSVHSVIFLLTTAILFSILRLYNVREIVGEKMTLNLRLCRD